MKRLMSVDLLLPAIRALAFDQASPADLFEVGQIAGAWLRASRIPRELIDALPNTTYIEQVADEFASTLKLDAEA